MSISEDKSIFLKRALRYLAISAFLLLFNFIYSLFAHGVASPYMQFAFLIPLVGGSLLSIILMFLPPIHEWSRQIWRMGLTTLIIGFLLHGVFDIYGSEAALVNVFFYASYGLLSIGFILFIINLIKSIKKLPHNLKK